MHEQQSLATIARPNPKMKSMTHPWTHAFNNFTLNNRFPLGHRVKTALIDFMFNHSIAQAKQAFHEKAAQ
jgi:hypothetical protein